MLLPCQIILNYGRGKYKILHFRIIEQQNTMLTLDEVKIWVKKTQEGSSVYTFRHHPKKNYSNKMYRYLHKLNSFIVILTIIIVSS